MATETGHPDNCTATPPSPVGGAQEKVEEKAEQVEVAEHGKIGYAPKEEMKEVNVCKADDTSKLQDQLEDTQIDVEGEAKEDEKLDKMALEVPNPKAEEKKKTKEDKQAELDPEEEVESKGQSYVSEVVDKTIEVIKPSETLEALMRKEKENHDEVIEDITSESCDKVPSGSKEVEGVREEPAQEVKKPEEKLEKNEERTEVDELEKVPSEKKNQEIMVKAPNGTIKNEDEKKEDAPVKAVAKQSNSIISKVKHSLVKAKKAIMGKYPIFKAISSDAEG